MTERYVDFTEFDRQTLGAALATSAEDARDVAFGAGSHLPVAEGTAALEVFPAAGVARVTTEDARIEVHRVPGVSVDVEKNRVVFEQGAGDSRTRLIVRSDGKVSFHPVLKVAEAAVPAQEPRTDAQAVSTPHDSSEGTTGADRPDVETGERASITLQGRLGRDPWFSTNEDITIAGFPLAVNEEHKTTWHKVVVFDETARSLREQHRTGDVRRGRLVAVTGQPVIREEETARGTKKVTELHATHVTRVRATKAR